MAHSDAMTADGSRLLVILAGLALLGASFWIGASWIDSGDNTCGSVVTPARWLDDGSDGSDDCRQVMTPRALETGAMVLAAATLLLRAVRSRPFGRLWLALAALGFVVAVSAVIANEAVRSGGLL
jgi:hypothetical protein